MPLSKSKGNMYPWVTHMHTHLGGECPHRCSYCYVQEMERRFHGGRYAGELRLVEHEFDVQYGSGRTIFIEHCNDLWAEDVPAEWIERVLAHCREWPDNTYVFQTKNPARYLRFLERLPDRRLLGCTVETFTAQLAREISHAPPPHSRLSAIAYLSRHNCERVFVTVEPVLKGNMERLANVVRLAKPEFVNIGADSKGTDLQEPTADEVRMFIKLLQRDGVEIREKRNLERLLG